MGTTWDNNHPTCSTCCANMAAAYELRAELDHARWELAELRRAVAAVVAAAPVEAEHLADKAAS